MSKHTPGPWAVEDRGCRFIVSKEGDGYITRDVCRMDGSTMSAFAQEANAHLIAAAPDLLEALHYAVRQVPELITVPGIRAAIAKAEGEPHADR